jgi:hypothetical protein
MASVNLWDTAYVIRFFDWLNFPEPTLRERIVQQRINGGIMSSNICDLNFWLSLGVVNMSLIEQACFVWCYIYRNSLAPAVFFISVCEIDVRSWLCNKKFAPCLNQVATQQASVDASSSLLNHYKNDLLRSPRYLLELKAVITSGDFTRGPISLAFTNIGNVVARKCESHRKVVTFADEARSFGKNRKLFDSSPRDRLIGPTVSETKVEEARLEEVVDTSVSSIVDTRCSICFVQPVDQNFMTPGPDFNIPIITSVASQVMLPENTIVFGQNSAVAEMQDPYTNMDAGAPLPDTPVMNASMVPSRESAGTEVHDVEVHVARDDRSELVDTLLGPAGRHANQAASIDASVTIPVTSDMVTRTNSRIDYAGLPLPSSTGSVDELQSADCNGTVLNESIIASPLQHIDTIASERETVAFEALKLGASLLTVGPAPDCQAQDIPLPFAESGNEPLLTDERTSSASRDPQDVQKPVISSFLSGLLNFSLNRSIPYRRSTTLPGQLPNMDVKVSSARRATVNDRSFQSLVPHSQIQSVKLTDEHCGTEISLGYPQGVAETVPYMNQSGGEQTWVRPHDPLAHDANLTAAACGHGVGNELTVANIVNQVAAGVTPTTIEVINNDEDDLVEAKPNELSLFNTNVTGSRSAQHGRTTVFGSLLGLRPPIVSCGVRRATFGVHPVRTSVSPASQPGGKVVDSTEVGIGRYEIDPVIHVWRNDFDESAATDFRDECDVANGLQSEVLKGCSSSKFSDNFSELELLRDTPIVTKRSSAVVTNPSNVAVPHFTELSVTDSHRLTMVEPAPVILMGSEAAEVLTTKTDGNDGQPKNEAHDDNVATRSSEGLASDGTANSPHLYVSRLSVLLNRSMNRSVPYSRSSLVVMPSTRGDGAEARRTTVSGLMSLHKNTEIVPDVISPAFLHVSTDEDEVCGEEDGDGEAEGDDEGNAEAENGGDDEGGGGRVPGLFKDGPTESHLNSKLSVSESAVDIIATIAEKYQPGLTQPTEDRVTAILSEPGSSEDIATAAETTTPPSISVVDWSVSYVGKPSHRGTMLALPNDVQIPVCAKTPQLSTDVGSRSPNMHVVDLLLVAEIVISIKGVAKAAAELAVAEATATIHGIKDTEAITRLPPDLGTCPPTDDTIAADVSSDETDYLQSLEEYIVRKQQQIAQEDADAVVKADNAPSSSRFSIRRRAVGMDNGSKGLGEVEPPLRALPRQIYGVDLVPMSATEPASSALRREYDDTAKTNLSMRRGYPRRYSTQENNLYSVESPSLDRPLGTPQGAEATNAELELTKRSASLLSPHCAPLYGSDIGDSGPHVDVTYYSSGDVSGSSDVLPPPYDERDSDLSWSNVGPVAETGGHDGFSSVSNEEFVGLQCPTNYEAEHEPRKTTATGVRRSRPSSAVDRNRRSLISGCPAGPTPEVLSFHKTIKRNSYKPVELGNLPHGFRSNRLAAHVDLLERLKVNEAAIRAWKKGFNESVVANITKFATALEFSPDVTSPQRFEVDGDMHVPANDDFDGNRPSFDDFHLETGGSSGPPVQLFSSSPREQLFPESVLRSQQMEFSNELLTHDKLSPRAPSLSTQPTRLNSACCPRPGSQHTHRKLKPHDRRGRVSQEGHIRASALSRMLARVGVSKKEIESWKGRSPGRSNVNDIVAFALSLGSPEKGDGFADDELPCKVVI